MPLTDEEKQGLSDEEISALEGDYADDEPVIEDKGDPDPPAADAESDDKKEDEPEDKKKDEPEDKKADDVKPDEPEVEKPVEKPKPVQSIPIVPKFPQIAQETIDAAKQEMADLKEKVDAGEPVFEDWQAARDKYNSLITKKEIYDESNKAAQEAVAEASKQGWVASQKAFLSLAENKVFSMEGNLAKYGAFSAHVNSILSKKEDENLTDFEVLELAKERTLKDLGIKSGAPTSDKEKEKALAEAKKQHGDRSKIKEDIGSLPGAVEDVSDTNEFDWLDRLDGEAYQKAIDKLTPEQQDRYAKYVG